MSRGGQPPDGPNVASDLITSTENEIAGDPQDGFDVSICISHKYHINPVN